MVVATADQEFVLPNDQEFVLPNDQSVVRVDARNAFQALAKQEQLYAHHLSKASFYGGLVVLLQTSPESPQIFRLIHRLNSAEKSEELWERASRAGVSQDEFLAFLVYCSGN
jgi:dipeptidyl-peptidase-3